MSDRMRYTVTFSLPWEPGPGWPGCETVEEAAAKEREFLERGDYDISEVLGMAEDVETTIATAAS